MIGSVKDWVVTAIRRPALTGLVLASGAVLGVTTVWVIDRVSQKLIEQRIGTNSDNINRRHSLNTLLHISDSLQEIHLPNRMKTIFAAALLLPGSIAIVTGKIVGIRQACFSFPLLTIGFALGTKMIEYYRTDWVFQVICQEHERATEFLDLSSMWHSLRQTNLSKMGEKISKKFSNYKTLRLLNCGLTNEDLKDLKKAGWFNHFKTIDLSNNCRLNFSGIKWIEKTEGLHCLILNNTDLTDSDLTQMADSGIFNNLKILNLANNPQITGRGIFTIAEKGFAGLQELDLSGNEQVIKSNLSDWLEKEGFKNLKSLNLAATEITENELEQMIEKAKWFRKLKGLNLDENSELRKFPSNILELTNLDDHSVSNSQLVSGGPIYFHGSGIFCRNCKNLACTKEVLQLALSGKVFGTVDNHRPLNLKSIANSPDKVKQIYESCGLPFEEDT